MSYLRQLFLREASVKWSFLQKKTGKVYFHSSSSSCLFGNMGALWSTLSSKESIVLTSKGVCSWWGFQDLKSSPTCCRSCVAPQLCCLSFLSVFSGLVLCNILSAYRTHSLKGRFPEETCGGAFNSERKRLFTATSNDPRTNTALHSVNKKSSFEGVSAALPLPPLRTSPLCLPG